MRHDRKLRAVEAAASRSGDEREIPVTAESHAGELEWSGHAYPQRRGEA
jgi:hypothetical protein